MQGVQPKKDQTYRIPLANGTSANRRSGGCYEVYGTTPEGDRVEAYFHPVTLEKLYVARRGEVLFRKKGY